MVTVVRISLNNLVSAVMLTALLSLGVFASLALNSESGTIDVKTVSITDRNIELSGLLYKPKSAATDSPAGAIVIAHGISGSKEMMSSIGLELARKGYVCLCLDLYGHGKSQGTINDGQKEPSFGVYAAIQYLKSQPYVNTSMLGLIGHSLGAGAVRAAAFKEPQISALVLIAGGVGEVTQGQQYGVLNSSYPRNLLVIVGKYDILFEINDLTAKQLPAVFGTQQVIPEVLYGSFSSQTARKLLLPPTTHLFEPIDQTVISESIDWMQKTLGKNPAHKDSDMGFVYPQREAAVAIALAALVGLTCLSFFPIGGLIKADFHRIPTRTLSASSKKWRLYGIWAMLNLALFVPMFAVGSAVPFPPLVFGASIAWWTMSTGLIGLTLLAKFSEKMVGRKIRIREELTASFNQKDLFTSIILFAFLFTITTLLAVLFNFNFRVISPILRDLSSANRALLFPAFIPFFVSYFVAESLYMHKLTNMRTREESNWLNLRNYVSTILGKIFPFVLLLCLQYIPQISFGIWVFPSFLGFLLELFWLIIPIFAIASSFSWWFYNKTENVVYGALFNALLMSWIAAAVFPF